MSEVAPIITVDASHPQPRHIERAAAVLEAGGVIAFPTDSYYGIGCDLHNKKALERVYQLKGMPRSHAISFICSELGEISRYAYVDNTVFRILKRKTPGPFTWILKASKLVPDLVLTRAKTVGIRIPGSPIALALVRALGRPILSTSAAVPGGEPLIDPRDIRDFLGHGLQLILDGGYQLDEPSTVVDLTGDQPVVLREGKGDAGDLG
jgi:tRNA threonylcarbamoyl adenosine modification protein (Sua5/YciO/YrdC/YwlC family)